MRRIRWGIIGCGDVTEVKSGPALQKASGSELVAVMRRDGGRARDYAARHNVPAWYDDAGALVDDPNVEAVYIATPPGSHAELAMKVAAAGKPCYVEKPMARSLGECQKMIDAFQHSSFPLFVAYYRRALPRFVKAKALLDSGAIGTITSCRYRITRPYQPEADAGWRVNVEQSGGGIFLDVGSHVLDLLDHLLGSFVESSGVAWSIRAGLVEDSVSVTFRTDKGVVGSASWNFAGSTSDEQLEIEGTTGRLTTGVLGCTPLTLDTPGGSEQFELPDPAHVQQPLIQTVVDELLGVGKCPSTGTSAARTSAVMDAVLHSFYGGRDDEFWRRPETWRKSSVG